MLSLVLFYRLMVGKYALIFAMEIQEIHVVVHILSGFALFTELFANQNTVHPKGGFI